SQRPKGQARIAEVIFARSIRKGKPARTPKFMQAGSVFVPPLPTLIQGQPSQVLWIADAMLL
ncbi:MAG TPA: hypothetical protein VF988_02580, partial [Verrucomicrobiae bacterium]